MVRREVVVRKMGQAEQPEAGVTATRAWGGVGGGGAGAAMIAACTHAVVVRG